MQWLEAIRVCGCWDAAAEERLRHDLPPELERLRSESRCQMADAFQHSEFPGDLAILIIWQGDACPRRSKEVSSLANYLASFGMVEHQLWVGFTNWSGLLNKQAETNPRTNSERDRHQYSDEPTTVQ